MKEMINRYYVTFNKAEYNAEYSFNIGKSGCFAYGNGTAVTFKCKDKVIDVIDTRYDKDVTKDFDQWCLDFMKNYFDPDLQPRIEKK